MACAVVEQTSTARTDIQTVCACTTRIQQTNQRTKDKIMAYKQSGMSVIAYANGFTLFHYSTMDSMETVIRDEEYFANAIPVMNVGDIIILNCGTDTCIRAIARLTNTTCSLDVLK